MCGPRLLILLSPYVVVFWFGVSKLFFFLFDTSLFSKRFFVNVGFRSFNVLKVSKAKVLSLLTSTEHLLHFFGKVLKSLS